MSFRLGLIHTPTPAHVPMLARLSFLRAAPPPLNVDWHKAIPANGDPLGNQTYGNCVPCAEYQTIAMRRANVSGDAWRPSEADTIARYAALTGFDPATGVPDDGTQTDQSMESWASQGIRLDSQNLDVVHWFSVQRRAIDQIKLAIAHFGPVQISVQLPAGLESDPTKAWGVPSSRTTGDWKPGSWGGHRVVCGKYAGDVFTVRTWGIDVPMSLEFLLTYVVAIDATLSREWIDTLGVAASGLSWASLQGEMGTLRA